MQDKVKEIPCKGWILSPVSPSSEEEEVLLKVYIRAGDDSVLLRIPEQITRAIRVDPKICTDFCLGPKLATPFPLVRVIQQPMCHTPPDFELLQRGLDTSPCFCWCPSLKHVVWQEVGKVICMWQSQIPQILRSFTEKKKGPQNCPNCLVPGFCNPILLRCIRVRKVQLDTLGGQKGQKLFVHKLRASVTLESQKRAPVCFS